MTKQELIEKIHSNYRKYDLSKTAINEIVDSVFNTISDAVRKNKRFTYPSFGTWTVRTRKARTGRNPQTGEKISIRASKTVGFRPAPKLKETL